MSTAPSVGRRERAKQEKLDRIVRAASALFAERGVDDVKTQEIADAADIGTGTLFLYARTKGELLLLVQNAHYEQALRDGRVAAGGEAQVVDAIMALLSPIVACNRVQVDNGRTYLREMLFGDPMEPNRAEARRFVAETQEALSALVHERTGRTHETATEIAHVISAAMFVVLAAADSEIAAAAIVERLRRQVAAVVGEP